MGAAGPVAPPPPRPAWARAVDAVVEPAAAARAARPLAGGARPSRDAAALPPRRARHRAGAAGPRDRLGAARPGARALRPGPRVGAPGDRQGTPHHLLFPPRVPRNRRARP